MYILVKVFIIMHNQTILSDFDPFIVTFKCKKQNVQKKVWAKPRRRPDRFKQSQDQEEY